jgi:hypothetical protein
VKEKFKKKCSNCKETLSLENFYIRSDAPHRRLSHCKKCNHNKYLARMKDESYRKNSVKKSKKWQKENPLRSKFLIARSNALNDKRRRSIAFSLTFEECVSMWNQGCYYCGDSLLNKSGSSLDRRDNNLGYSLENVLPCCGKCNKIRNTFLTVEEMKVAMTAVLLYRSSN